MESRDERRLLKQQRELQAVKLLIVDELGYVPLSPTCLYRTPLGHVAWFYSATLAWNCFAVDTRRC
jgi:hypothetical protein